MAIFEKNYSTKVAIKELSNTLPLRKNWLRTLIEEIAVKYLTQRGDLHLGNIGITNYGDFRYFDSAHPRWQNYINSP